MGRIFRLINKARKGGANHFYNWIWVEDANGANERALPFTDAEIARAEARRLKNPEDVPKRSFLIDLTD